MPARNFFTRPTASYQTYTLSPGAFWNIDRAACLAWLVVLEIRTNTVRKRHVLTEEYIDDIGARSRYVFWLFIVSWQNVQLTLEQSF
jgi:hypothetical protein